MGAVDGPWEGVVKQVSIIVLSAEERKCHTACKFLIHPACQIQILQLPEYKFHVAIVVDALFTVTYIRLFIRANGQSFISPARDNCHDNDYS